MEFINSIDFIGRPVQDLHNLLTENGWKMIECFNDYKWVWVNHNLNKSIIAKTEFTDAGVEEINSMFEYKGIYMEYGQRCLSEEEKQYFIESFKKLIFD